jgi:hypothetical protein
MMRVYFGFVILGLREVKTLETQHKRRSGNEDE